MNSVKERIRVIETFAGVGGFSHGLVNIANKKLKKHEFSIVWANQWEPRDNKQTACEIYKERFPDVHIENQNIEEVDSSTIPDHDLLTGGFPCQDFSVAKSNTLGIDGSKGKLALILLNIIEEKKPKVVFLENVWRLLASPNKDNKGRDFLRIIKDLSNIGYQVSWRKIDASRHGYPQKRIRLYILATRNDFFKIKSPKEINKVPIFNLNGSSPSINDKGIKVAEIEPPFSFPPSGIVIRRSILKVENSYEKEGFTALKEIIRKAGVKSKDLEYLNPDQIEKARVQKMKCKIERTTKEGFKYFYSQGSMSFPENINRPSRTILTGEGSISRTSHFIEDNNKKIRKMHPVEAELLNGFEKGWTLLSSNKSVTNKKRLFFMGNSLITGLVGEIGEQIVNLLFTKS